MGIHYWPTIYTSKRHNSAVEIVILKIIGRLIVLDQKLPCERTKGSGLPS